MILPVLVALLTALGPLLQGSCDPWSQALLNAAMVIGLCVWMALLILVGHVPVSFNKTLVWAALLAGLSALSAACSPLQAAAWGDWRVLLHALWLFPAMAMISKDERSWIDEAIRWSAWVLMALAFYQHFAFHEERPASALLNQNVYAGAILLLLPLAVEKRDWLLAAGLVWTMLWTRSVGAWLGLALALVVTQQRRSFWFWGGCVAAVVCAVALYSRLGTPQVLHRWWWWKAAAQMALDRPWLGYGPGTFSFILPAYLPAQREGLYSLYAHQYLLETLAGCGLPFTLLWIAGLWRCVVHDDSHKRFGVIAVLFQSLWDYTLSIPSNLWLFAYFAASSIPHIPGGFNIPSRYKLPAFAAVMGLGLGLSGMSIQTWKGYRAHAAAQEAFRTGDDGAAAGMLEEARRYLPDHPEIPRLQAAMEMHRAQTLSGGAHNGAWVAAAAALELAVRLNPYRHSGWTQLSLAYRTIGQPETADEVLRESEAYQARGRGNGEGQGPDSMDVLKSASTHARLAVEFALKKPPRVGAALYHLDRAIAADPRQALYWGRRAELFAAFQDWTRSREAALKAVSLEPSFAEAYLVLAESFLGLGDARQARSAVVKALSLRRGSGPARNAHEAALQIWDEGRYQRVRASLDNKDHAP